MAQVVISRQARRDLVEIGDQVAERSGSQERADRLLDRIETTFEFLAAHPQMGQLRTEFSSGVYRSFSVGNYVIYFQPDEDGIRVARVLHGARDHDALL